MANRRWAHATLLTLLAVVFTIGLTFASIELPDLLHEALVKIVPANQGDSHADDAALLRTELFLRHYHLRTIGYGCFGLMIVLIVVGFALGRRGPAVAGALLLFLPVFAQFAGVMFFLAGLGVLNLAWLPVLEFSFAAGQLGDIVILPYRLVHSLFEIWNINIHQIAVVLTLSSGLLLFTIGTLAWFSTRYRGRDVADLWVYRLSRHPQYLGWILWTYGMLLALMRVSYPKRSWAIGASLPWLLSAMIIIGVALMEEGSMRKRAGEEYDAYRNKAPFLLPLPRFLSEMLTWPSRLLFRKRLPEKAWEIGVILSIFTLVLVGMSAVYNRARNLPPIPKNIEVEMPPDASTAEAYIRALQIADTWHGRRPYVQALETMGDTAVRPLIGLLGDADPSLREIAASTLGKIGSQEAIGPLILSLEDPNPNVRFWAAGSLGRLRAQAAVEPLTRILVDQSSVTNRSVAAALGNIGSEEAVEPLIAALGDPRPWTRAAVVHALGQIGSELAVDPLLELLNDDEQEIQVRRATVISLGQIGSPRSAPSLRNARKDDDAEVRRYASQALKNVLSN